MRVQISNRSRELYDKLGYDEEPRIRQFSRIRQFYGAGDEARYK